MRKLGMFTPHGGDQAQQPQVKHDKRKPAKPRVDQDLGKLEQLVHDDNLK